VGPTWHDANVNALVWVQGYQVQGYGFAVGQQVTWPISGQLNLAALTETVGAATAAQISMAVDFYARRPEDTVTHTGVVLQIESYRCRHVRGHSVPGSVVSRAVSEAVFAGSDEDIADVEDGVDFVGYLVTLANLRPTLEGH
jgi:hypothetical protein